MGTKFNDIEIDRIGELEQIYMVSNTPYFLYNYFQNHDVVKAISENYSFEELKKEFISRGSKGVKSIPELVIEYAIYIAIFNKGWDKVYSFIEDEGNIHFEWFQDLKEIYIANNSPINEESVSIKLIPPEIIECANIPLIDYPQEVQIKLN